MRGALKRLTKLCLLLLFVSLLAIGGAALATQYVFQEPAHVTWVRYAKPEFLWQRQKYPSIKWLFDLLDPILNRTDPRDRFIIRDHRSPPDGPLFSEDAVVGPRLSGIDAPRAAATETVSVSSPEGLRAAIQRAGPGTVIELLPGTYAFSGASIAANKAGSPDRPVVVRAAEAGTVKLKFSLLEGFHVTAPYWTFENLVIEGTCRNDTHCEHAFHVVGDAAGVVIQNNWVSNFNAPVKVNAKAGRFPDEGLILRNAFVNDRPRNTDKPVTLLDIVAASRWRVQKNIVADFAKAGGNHTSYAAFFKGAGEDNIFEQNLVRCEWRHSGGARIGFSFGDGGTAHRHCRDKSCVVQHRRGIVRNNVIMNCPNDAGIYLNKSAETLIHNNTLINTRGIDVRREESDAKIVNNIIDGRIYTREGGTFSAAGNAISAFKAALLRRISDAIYADPTDGNLLLKDRESVIKMGVPVEGDGLDFCDQPYGGGQPDIGPIQYSASSPCTPTFFE